MNIRPSLFFILFIQGISLHSLGAAPIDKQPGVCIESDNVVMWGLSNKGMASDFIHQYFNHITGNDTQPTFVFEKSALLHRLQFCFKLLYLVFISTVWLLFYGDSNTYMAYFHNRAPPEEEEDSDFEYLYDFD